RDCPDAHVALSRYRHQRFMPVVAMPSISRRWKNRKKKNTGTSIRTVAIVGCGIGRSHIVEGYLPHSDKFKVVAICD
ncbi:hypothetical protein AB9F39_39255, partial [Rhizobium leguminosarum]